MRFGSQLGNGNKPALNNGNKQIQKRANVAFSVAYDVSQCQGISDVAA